MQAVNLDLDCSVICRERIVNNHGAARRSCNHCNAIADSTAVANPMLSISFSFSNLCPQIYVYIPKYGLSRDVRRPASNVGGSLIPAIVVGTPRFSQCKSQ